MILIIILLYPLIPISDSVTFISNTKFRITGREDNVYSPLSHNQSILLDNDDTYHIKGEIGSKLEINSLNNLKKTADGTKRALNIIKEVYLEGTYIHKEYLFYSLAKLIHGDSPVRLLNN